MKIPPTFPPGFAGWSRLQRRILLALSLTALVLLSTQTAGLASSSSPLRHRLALSVGSPQTIALGYEYALASPLQVQANVGTILLVSGLNTRVLVVPDEWRLQPYAFVGGGVFYAWGLEYGDPDGWSGFTWVGGGLRLKIHRFLIFGELGEISNLKESNGYDSYYTSGAVGILYEF